MAFLFSSLVLLSSTRTLFPARVRNCRPLSQSKFTPSEYCIRIMGESYVCGLKTSISVADPGKGPEGSTPRYFWTKLRPEVPKNIFLKKTPPRLIAGSGWPPPPPPLYLKVWIRRWISPIKDNFLRLTHKSGKIVLNTWWLWVPFSELTKSYQSSLKVSSFK